VLDARAFSKDEKHALPVQPKSKRSGWLRGESDPGFDEAQKQSASCGHEALIREREKPPMKLAASGGFLSF
jgi:hypothetical protein